MELKHKSIVITGGTTGIGYELVRLLHPSNRLFVIARNRDRLALLQTQFDTVLTHGCDLSVSDNASDAASAAIDALGSVDVLINNAAVQHTPRFTEDDFDISGIEREITLNFTAVCQLTAELLPHLLAVLMRAAPGLARKIMKTA